MARDLTDAPSAGEPDCDEHGYDEPDRDEHGYDEHGYDEHGYDPETSDLRADAGYAMDAIHSDSLTDPRSAVRGYVKSLSGSERRDLLVQLLLELPQ
jgi:hypothetical protein